MLAAGSAYAQSANDQPEAAPFGEAFDLTPPASVPSPETVDTPDISEAPSPAPQDRAARLDELFTQLKRTADTDEAQALAVQIQAEWMAAESDTTALLMRWSSDAIGREDRAAALDLLDQIVLLDPGYAEGWNRRATLNYEMSRYGQSLADIEQTLAREPRHFGALMGLATMLEMFDRKAEAIEVYQRVLDVYPALEGAQEAIGRLAEETSGQPS